MMGERLRLFRTAKGFSMDDLSEATEGAISKQALSKYENGRMKASPSKIVLLARALGVKAARFMGEPQIQVEFIAYRKKGRLKEKEKARIKGLMQLRMEVGMKIQSFLNMQDGKGLGFSPHRFCSVEEAEEVSVDLRNSWGLGTDPIPNVLDALEQNNINVLFTNGDREMRFDGISAWVKDEEGKVAAAVIATRSDVSWARQRMNLAHELGHLIQMPDAAPDEEKVAFRFAGAFLAPKPLVISDFGKRERLPDHEELLLLKKRYGLSMQAIIRRLYDLGLISGSTYTTANIQMNRAGFKKKEPLDDDIKPETSTLSRLRALRALRDGIIPEDEFYLFVGESDPGSVNRVEIFSGFSGTPRRKLDSGDIDKLNVFFNSMESKEWEEMGIAR